MQPFCFIKLQASLAATHLHPQANSQGSLLKFTDLRLVQQHDIDASCAHHLGPLQYEMLEVHVEVQGDQTILRVQAGAEQVLPCSMWTAACV